MTLYTDIHGPQKMKRTESQRQRERKRDGWISARALRGVNRGGF